MTDMDILSELIKDDALIQTHMEYGRPAVTLIEKQESDSKMTIQGLPDDALIINADIFAAPKKIFKNTKHECKRADYVIISEKKKCIVYIEMKKSTGSGIVKQLLGAQCFIAYCREIGKAFWEKNDFLHDYRNRFIAAPHTGSKKGKMRHIPESGLHDTPQNHRKLYGQKSVQFSNIAK